MSDLKVGDKAPDFEAENQDGEKVKLSNYKGKKVVIYFYPKDNTPGCTAEACSIRDSYDRFLSEGYIVLGISPDSKESHIKFIEKFKLPFPLIADTDKVVATAYGVWTEKSMFGKTYMGIKRTTFVINEDGNIERIIKTVKTKEHAEQLLYK